MIVAKPMTVKFNGQVSKLTVGKAVPANVISFWKRNNEYEAHIKMESICTQDRYNQIQVSICKSKIKELDDMAKKIKKDESKESIAAQKQIDSKKKDLNEKIKSFENGNSQNENSKPKMTEKGIEK